MVPRNISMNTHQYCLAHTAPTFPHTMVVCALSNPFINSTACSPVVGINQSNSK